MIDAYKLMKDEVAWDYSTHRSDCERWQEKVLREEPEAKTEIMETTFDEMMEWKSS